MKKMMNKGMLALLAVAMVAMPVMAQDSVSLSGGLPGDAVSPWADGNAPLGSEQCNDFVVDLVPFQTAWGTTFGIAPLIKGSKSSSDFYNSLVSAQSLSRRQAEVPTGQDLSFYPRWDFAGGGINNDGTINTLDGAEEITYDGGGMRFGVVFAEFGTTDSEGSYNGIVGAMVDYLPSNPGQLLVHRVMAASNGCDPISNYAQFGIGTVDANGYIHFRADDYGVAGGDCGYSSISGDNIFRVDMSLRDCEIQNVISAGYPGAGFDTTATTDWLIRSSSTVHSAPSMVSSLVTGQDPLYIGPNFDSQYVRGYSFGAITSDLCQLDNGVGTDHRGTIGYTSRNCSFLSSEMGIAGVLQKNGDLAQVIGVWGLDTAGNCTGTKALQLPTGAITDNATGETNIPGLNQFDHYHGTSAFRGGVGQVALGVDRSGNLLAAAAADHPVDGGPTWNTNYIAVARMDCETGAVRWTMAGYNYNNNDGKPIYDGSGTEIAQMVTFAGPGPSLSSPMIDSVGNVYFTSAIKFSDSSDVTVGLLRAVYDETLFAFNLELVVHEGQVFHGANSDRDYEISFLQLTYSGGISSGAPFSTNVSEVAHLGGEPGDWDAGDPRSLGGLVLNADIVYDYDMDGDFDDPTSSGGDPNSLDESYQVVLYIGALDAEVVECPTAATIVGGGFAGTTVSFDQATQPVVDARQPWEPASMLPRLGLGVVNAGGTDDRIVLDMNGVENIPAECFELCETASYPEGANGLTVTELAGGQYQIELDRAITVEACTTITYLGDGSQAKFIGHPANLNGDGLSESFEVLALVDYLNNISDARAWEIYSSDMNHSGAVESFDVIRMIDLLSATGPYAPGWNNSQLPSCTDCE
jgi:hypothetical protein